MKATILSSRRVVPILVEGDTFWVVRPLVSRSDAMLFTYCNIVPVSGPYRLDDARFAIDMGQGDARSQS